MLYRGRSTATLGITDAVVDLPTLDSTLDHAMVQSVEIGPRREIALFLRPLTWCGQSGARVSLVHLRFGTVANLDEAAAFFREHARDEVELGSIRYAFGVPPTPGNVLIDVVIERELGSLRIQCGNVMLQPTSSSVA